LDAIHAISDDSEQHFLHELQQRVQQGPGQTRYVHLMLENHLNESQWLPSASPEHKVSAAQWGDDFHHALHVILTGEAHSYYADYHRATSHHSPHQHLARALARGFSFEGEPSVMCGAAGRGNSADNLECTQLISFLQNHDMVGNRPYAERMPQLVPSAQAHQAALALWLLAPQTPMLFMGDEVACEQPFVFFTDVEKNLHAAIRKGRKRQFEDHPAVMQKNSKPLADPCSEQSFRLSQLNWLQLLASDQRKAFQLQVKQLLRLRQRFITPLLPQLKVKHTHWQVFGATGVWVTWANAKGQPLLSVVANMGFNVVDPPEGFDTTGLNQLYPAQAMPKLVVPPWQVYWFVNSLL
jgi:malto-oligosyltrehalose trehalohydrolase